MGRAVEPSETDKGRVPGNAARPVNARSLLFVTAGVCAAGFAIPWIALTALQRTTPAQPQTVVVPAGAKVTILRPTPGASSGVTVVTGLASSTTTTGTTTTTTASRPPPGG